MSAGGRVALVLDAGFGTLLGSQHSAARITAYLHGRGFEVAALRKTEVVRTRVREQLEALRGRLADGDAFVLYFVGHGDRIRAPHGDVTLLVTYDLLQQRSLPGISGAELLSWLAPVASATGNVTLILDCCRAAGMAAGAAADDAVRAQIDAVLRQAADSLRVKYAVSTPRSDATASIVRVVAAPDNEVAVERLRDGADGRIGVFTDALVGVLEQHDTLPWADLLPLLQSRVLAECPTQTPGVEGPRWRLPFSRRERPPLDEHPCSADLRGWRLHSGTLHGVEVGDVFTLAGVEGRAREVGLDFARLEVRPGQRLPPLTRARRIACMRRDNVAWSARLDAGAPAPALYSAREQLLKALASAPELALSDEDPAATIEPEGTSVLLRDAAGEPVHMAAAWTEPELVRMVQALRLVARWRRQTAIIDALTSNSPLRLEWGRERHAEALPLQGAELHAGERVWVRASSDGSRPELFVSLFHVRADRSIVHVTEDLAHGVVVMRRRAEALTQTRGDRARPLELAWRESVPRDAARTETLVAFASTCPRSLHRLATEPFLAPREATPQTTRGGDERATLTAVRIDLRVMPRGGGRE